MVDINIIASGDLARLLVLEAQRAGLSYAVTDVPVNGARVYVADASLGTEKLIPDKTLFIGAEGFPHTLPAPFLLSEFREKLAFMLFGTVGEKPKPAPKRKRKNIDLDIDKNASCAIVRGREIKLSPAELALYEALLSRRGKVLTYAEAREIIGGEGSNKVNVYICFLRKKLEAGGDKIILSVRGEGFTIRQ